MIMTLTSKNLEGMSTDKNFDYPVIIFKDSTLIHDCGYLS